MAHIWACPPSEGDDYIFHCHPTEQKIPKPKRLQEWYKKMLDKGMVERIVLDYKVRLYKFNNYYLICLVSVLTVCEIFTIGCQERLKLISDIS